MSRFWKPTISDRQHGPAVGAAGDGLEGCYSAVIHTAPSGGLCQIVIDAFDSNNTMEALCGLTAAAGAQCLVLFDENKTAWVVAVL